MNTKVAMRNGGPAIRPRELLQKTKKLDLPKRNTEITASHVRVIGSDGSQAGILSLIEAIKLAETESLDLVEVSAGASPPVCRVMDFDKLRFERQKAEKKQRGARDESREVQFRPNTDQNDIAVKLRKVQEFLNDGARVRLVQSFRGREVAYADTLGRKRMEEILQKLDGCSEVAQPLQLTGKMMTVTVKPKKKKSL